MRAIDLSLMLYDNFQTHASHPRVIINQVMTHAFSAPRYKPPCKGFASTQLIISDHAGTHVDAPIHFFPGAASLESQPLDLFFGMGILIDISHKPADFTADVSLIEETLKKDKLEIRPGDIVLLRVWPGKWGEGKFHETGTLTVEAARWLHKHGMKALGTDISSIDTMSDKSLSVHMYLLEAGVPIYENLANLEKIPVKRFQFFGLPMNLKGATGSPVRAMALVDE